MSASDKYYKQIRDNIQGRHNAYVKNKQKLANPVDRTDFNIMNMGEKWYFDGYSLDEAPDNVRNNRNFIYGFEHAKRLQDVNDDFFRRGSKAYFDGINLAAISESDRNNENFMAGYEDAMTMNLRKRR